LGTPRTRGSRPCAGFERVQLFFGDADRIYHPIDAARQRQAVQFLIERAFATPAALVDPNVLERLEAGGAPDRILGGQKPIRASLLSDARLKRMAEHAQRAGGDAYTPAQLMADLHAGIRAELGADPGVIDLYRRNPQRARPDLLVARLQSDDDSTEAAAPVGDGFGFHEKPDAASLWRSTLWIPYSTNRTVSGKMQSRPDPGRSLRQYAVRIFDLDRYAGMPISPYPRPGHPIAPTILAPFLQHKAPRVGVLFSELDATAWDRFSPATCRNLGRKLIERLKPRVNEIETLVGAERVAPAPACLTLQQLDIETRTFNCLIAVNIDEAPGGVAGLTVRDALAMRAFGVKSLVDLLTSVEAAVAACPGTTDVPLRRNEPAKTVFPVDICGLIRRYGYAPACIEALRMPALPRDILLEDLGLRNRTLHALIQAGYQDDPTRLGGLTFRQFMALPKFGAVSLCDLIEAVERIANRRCELPSGQDVRRDEWRLVVDTIRDADAIPNSVLTSTIPPLPPRSTIKDLGLQPRTRSVLDREGITRTSQLTDRTVGSLCELRGFGRACVLDLLTSVCRLRESAGRLGHDKRPHYREIDKTVKAICSVPGVSSVGKSDPRLGRLLRNVDAGIATIGDLRDNCKRSAVLGRKRVLDRLQATIRHCEGLTVERELFDLIVGQRAPSRNSGLVAEYYGFHGQPLQSLQAIGARHGLSRERIRQICAPNRITRLPQPPFAPAIDAALALVRDQVPASRSRIERLLVERHLVEAETTIECLLRVGRFLRREADFAFLGTGKSAFVVSPAEFGPIKQVESTARRLVFNYGAAAIDEVLERCGDCLPKTNARGLVVAAVELLTGFRWLDVETGWFGFDGSHHTRLRQRIRKVLSVCGPIDVEELRSAMGRDFRWSDRIPPKGVLLELCRQMREVVVDGEFVKAKVKGGSAALLRGAEAKIVEIFLKHGPICRLENLQHLASEAGIGDHSFWRCLVNCPTISRYAPRVYGLVGAKATPALIESPPNRRRADDR